MFDYNRLSTYRLEILKHRKKREIKRLEAYRFLWPHQKERYAQLGEQIKQIESVLNGRYNTLPLWGEL